jgi:hypothetical protein
VSVSATPASAPGIRGAVASGDPLAGIFQRSSPLPKSSSLSCGPYCYGNFTTPTVKAFGPDCASAQSSLSTELDNFAQSQCAGGLGVCTLTQTTTTACHLKSNGSYVIGGYGTFSCRDTTC